MAGPPYGVTDQGFVIKSQDQILTDMQNQELASISPALNVQPTGLIGVLNGIMSQEIYDLWQLAGVLYSGMDPDIASGDQLTGLALITGTQRQGPTATICVGCVVNVAPGTYLAGSLIANVLGQPTFLFTNTDDVINSTLSAANFTVNFQCTVTGPVIANANSLTVINTPVIGWNSVNNPQGMIEGQDEMSDAALRNLRVQELEAAGSSTADAIRSDILLRLQPPGFYLGGTTQNIIPVTFPTVSCTVLFNDSDVIDANGLPPHSIECIIYQPDYTPVTPGQFPLEDYAAAELILDSKAAGIGTHGTFSALATDTQGNQETIYFTRPQPVDITVVGELVVNPNTFPPDPAGINGITQKLVYYVGLNQFPGQIVYRLHMEAQVFPDVDPPDASTGIPIVPGVLDVNSFVLGGGTLDGNGNVLIDIRQIAVLSSLNVTLTDVP